MEYGIGIALALGVSSLARVAGLDRDRAFYTAMVFAIASYYVLFAVLGESRQALVAESVGMAGFVAVAVLGFRLNMWLVVACLAGHGVFDWAHPLVVANPGVPEWWPGFCLAFDVGAASFLAWLLLRRREGVSQAS
jgi:hypothetical protein